MKKSLILLLVCNILYAANTWNPVSVVDLSKIVVFGPTIGGKINSLKRNCILLVKGDGSESSYVGGMPRIEGVDKWPKNKNKPMSFVAQIDLAVLNGDSYLSYLPSSGGLMAYYDNEQGGWGFDPKNKDYFKIQYIEKLASRETNVPDGLKADLIFKRRHVKGIRSVDWPSIDVLINNGVSLTDNQQLIYCGLLEKVSEKNAGFKVGGYPNDIQGDMTLECQLVTNGLYCGDASGYNDPRRSRLEKGSKDWNLILQIDSCDEIGMMWGDSGMLYYWIKDNDLAARRFDLAWLISQCY